MVMSGDFHWISTSIHGHQLPGHPNARPARPTPNAEGRSPVVATGPVCSPVPLGPGEAACAQAKRKSPGGCDAPYAICGVQCYISVS